MRQINARFIYDLLKGELAFFLEKVKNNRDKLSLEIRNGYINIYYKGGNLLKITQKAKGYSFHFDAKYCKHKNNSQNFELLNRINSNDIESYKAYFKLMIHEMDSWFEEHPKKERDYQHKLLVNNPEIIDIEYQIARCMRLDMLLFMNEKLYIVENKYGIGAINGNAGLSKHYNDICNVLSNSKLLDEMLNSICCISKAKKALGLIDFEIQRDDIKSVEILFLLANYNIKSNSLSSALKGINSSVPANILMTDQDEYKIDLTRSVDSFAYED